VSQKNENADHFLKEATADAKEIYDRLVNAFPEGTTKLEIDPVVKRVNTIRFGEEEEFLHKVCSKFIHPTSLVLENPEGTILNDGYRKVFAVKVIFYAWGLIETFHTISWIE